MSKMKNYMMDIKEFCDYMMDTENQSRYAGFLGGESLTIDEIATSADEMFRSTMAGDYAKDYLKRQYGE